MELLEAAECRDAGDTTPTDRAAAESTGKRGTPGWCGYNAAGSGVHGCRSEGRGGPQSSGPGWVLHVTDGGSGLLHIEDPIDVSIEVRDADGTEDVDEADEADGRRCRRVYDRLQSAGRRRSVLPDRLLVMIHYSDRA